MMICLVAGATWPAHKRELSASTNPGIPASDVYAGVIHGLMSSAMPPLPLMKLVKPFVLAPLLNRLVEKKFICITMLVSEVSWNSGVVSPDEAKVPGNL